MEIFQTLLKDFFFRVNGGLQQSTDIFRSLPALTVLILFSTLLVFIDKLNIFIIKQKPQISEKGEEGKNFSYDIFDR